MPSIQGSSRILNTSGINGLTGPTGALGPTGPTGSTGPTGPVGSSDVVGVGIISASTGASGWSGGSIGSDEIVFYLTDGTTLGISGARGATGDITTQDFSITNSIDGPGYGKIFSIKNGITAYFKSLTVTGKDISIGATSDYTILLDGVTYEQGMLGNTGELVFNFSGASAQGALNTHWSGDELTARILTHREVKDGNNIVIGEVVNVRGEKAENTETIVGTADVDGTAVSFTYITQHQETSGDPIVKGMVSAFHLGQTGNSDGSSADVIYEFTGLTYDSLFSGSIEDVGSCCFCLNVEGPDRSDCVDFVTRNYCDGIGGSFSNIACLNRPEGPSCYPQGACCLLGGCAETSQEKCDTYGGFFVDGHTCEEVAELGGCPEECGDNIGACCINNVCFELTEYQCSFEPNSFWVEGSCDTVNCCLETQTGACCLDEKCYNASALLCSQMASTDGSPGIFWGIGSRCAGPGDESLYYPRNCTQRGEGETTFGNCDTPPCEGCVGWTQEIRNVCQDDDGLIINICACDGVECPCDNGDGQYGCNVCGSNTEACSTIITADGSCWECCCESDIPDEGLGWCCNPKENETTGPSDFCLYYDENNEIQGNCNWGCYYGDIDGCIYQGADNCDSEMHSMTFMEYRCSLQFLQLLNQYLDYDDAYDALMQEEPYASQCFYRNQIAIGGPTDIIPYFPCVQLFDPLNPGATVNCSIYGDYESGFEWTFTPYDDNAPECSVWRIINGENVFGFCFDRAPLSNTDVQCVQFEDRDTLACPDSDEPSYCRPVPECCETDVTTNPPLPLPPDRQNSSRGNSRSNSRRSRNNGGGGCYPSTEESCVNGGGDWYSDIEECNQQCNVEEDVYGACCYDTDDTVPCQYVEESFCPPSIGTFYPNQNCDVCESPSDFGACCVNGTDCSNQTYDNCVLLGGVWSDSFLCETAPPDYCSLITGACCNIVQGTCYGDSYTINDCALENNSQFYEGYTCDICDDEIVGKCCGGQVDGQPVPCGQSYVVSEAVCIDMGTNEYPSKWFADSDYDCCGNCCWWGGDENSQGFNCTSVDLDAGCPAPGECLFYHCDQLVDFGVVGTAPCYIDGNYQDVTWTSEDCSSSNGNAGCPTYNELGCCSWLVEGDLNHQVTRCYCEQGDDGFEWYEGECTTTEDPDATQACCMGQSCFDLTVEECNDWGGQLRGEGTSCADQPSWCTGACCENGTGVCDDDFTAIDCTGLWQGYGTDCNSVQCLVQGACCNTTTNECTVVDSEANCDGNYMGDGSICVGEEGDYDECGACCADNSCNDNFTATACSDQPNWEKFFMDQFCDDVTCSEQIGACCSLVSGVQFCSDNVAVSECQGISNEFCPDELCVENGGNGCGQCVLSSCCYRRFNGAGFVNQCDSVSNLSECSEICSDDDFNSNCLYYFGKNCDEVCGETSCPACEEETQACCTLTGCVDVTEDDCINVEGGDPRGVGTTCSDSDICGGACCENGTGVCVEFSYPSCGPNATWQGYGTSCNPNPCEDARGACCYKNNGNNECSDDETESSCSNKCIQNIFYTECKWQGAFTNCIQANCGGGVSPP